MTGEWVYFHWQAFGWSIWEGMVPEESVACWRAAGVAFVMLLIAIAVQRWENYRDDPRSK